MKLRTLVDLTGEELRRAGAAWNRFWFGSSSPEAMTLFRQALGSLLFIFYLIRTLDLNLLFSETGLIPLAILKEATPMQYRYSVLHLSTSPVLLWSAHIALLLSLFSMARGYWPRISAIVAFILHVSFMHRNMAAVFGIDLISTFFLLYLCFAKYELPKSSECPAMSDLLGSMAFRLSQIQVCLIYGYSGLEKIRGIQWWKGEALWTVMANAQLARWDLSWVSNFPLLIVLATYLTLLWEIYFPVLIWLRKFRYFMLVFGALLHIGIALVVSIPFFGMLMITTYCLFLEPPVASRISRLAADKLLKLQILLKYRPMTR
jgi:hypothetical protein